jgi:hypothetical protein
MASPGRKPTRFTAARFGHVARCGRLRRDWGRDAARADAPTVRVHAVGCFATVDVWRVPRDLQGSYSEIFREIERRQRELPR